LNGTASAGYRSAKSSSATEMAARALTSDPDTTAERPNRQLEACPGSQGGLQRADALRRCVSLTADREGVNVTSSHPKSVRMRAIAHVVVETETIATLFNQC
jgi:hypothetical protein